MTFASETDKYLDYTHRLNDYNEISNLNEYLLKINDIEEEKLKSYNDIIRNKVLKLKQEYLLLEHGMNEYRLRINILYLSIVISCGMLLLVSIFALKSIGKKMMVMLCTVLGIIYLIIVLIILAINKNRRKYAWNQYYWDPVKKT